MMKHRIYADLGQLPSGCEALFDEAGKSSFFHTLPWFRNLAENGLPADTDLHVYVIGDGSGVKGVLPMRKNGRRLESLSNYYTSLFTPIVEEPVEEPLRVFAEAVSKGRWEAIDLHPMDADSSVFRKTHVALRSAGMIVLPYFCFGNWYLDVAGRSYQGYYDSLPSKLKNTLKRKSKQLNAMNDASIEIVVDREEVEKGIAAFEKVYKSSWKVQEPFPDFMPGLIRTCAENGWLRLGVVHVGGEPVAAQVWMVKDGIASIYKLAYDERHAKLSAGSILTARLMEHVIDVDKVHEVDYLTGDDDYKKDWMSARRERWGLTAYNSRTFRGLVTGMLNLGWRKYKEARHGRSAP